jgi:hypothetical protein
MLEVMLVSSHCDKIPAINDLKEEIFSAHGFRDFEAG